MEKFKNIRLLALDFDGTLTVGALVVVSQDGQESVVCSRRDSLGVEMLQKAGVAVIVISKETNPVVKVRCEKMKVACVSGVDTAGDKLAILKDYADKAGLTPAQVVFVGDDINDLACLDWAGMGVAVKDAQPEVAVKADYVTAAKGGRGAVREVCDLILEAQS